MACPVSYTLLLMDYPGGQARCSSCGGVFGTADMVSFGDAWVCAACKPAYFQRIQQGEQPQRTMVYAGFWIRFVAKLIDGVILYLAQMPLVMLMGSAGTQPPANPAELAAYFSKTAGTTGVAVAMGVAYTVFFLGRFGATPGKMALKLKVVRPEGEPISYLQALGRYFGEIVSSLTCSIGYIVAGFDTEKRALHDRIAATRVLRAG
jgi:uncharacterized RDD family membrane protein YckC